MVILYFTQKALDICPNKPFLYVYEMYARKLLQHIHLKYIGSRPKGIAPLNSRTIF